MDSPDSPSPESRAELLLATRAALRALPSLYAARDCGRSEDAEVAAAEIFCLLGLHVALGSEAAPGPTRQELMTFVHRVMESLLQATNRPRESWATVAAFGVRHGIVNGANPGLTDLVVNLAENAIASWNSSLAAALRRATAADQATLTQAGIEPVAAAPLWPEDLTQVVAESLRGGNCGSARLRGWYGHLLRGREWFVRGSGDLIAQMIARVGPPLETPGERAVYASAEVLAEQTMEVAGAGPPPARESMPAPAPPPPPPSLSGDEFRSRGVPEAAPGDTTVFYPAPSAPAEPPARAASGERVVNTGFALPEYPENPLHNREPLAHSQALFFWLEVGPLIAGSIEKTPTPIPWEKLPVDAVLTVALFDFGDGLEILSATGALKLGGNGQVVVERQPGQASLEGIPADLIEKRLFFRLRTPPTGIETRLRCNIYCKQVLVQSRLIVARLDDSGGFVDGALASTLDYTLSRSLRSDVLDGLGEHRLSVMLNDGVDGKHHFRFLGAGATEFTSTGAFGENELADLLEQGRQALRTVAWGSAAEWNRDRYRYDQPPAAGQLEQDLVTLAVSGYRFYDSLVSRLSDRDPAKLEALMRRPGLVQFTARRSPKELVPAALIYDRVLDSQAPKLSLCSAFRDALAQRRPLDQEPCFLGDCPHAGEDTVVCPGGFWGFRHDLGIPISLAADGEDLDATTVIAAGPGPTVAVCVSTDPGFVRRQGHQDRMRALFGAGWGFADSRDDVKRLLARSPCHLIYFYCHGGRKGTVPYLLVGADGVIARDNIRAFGWNWRGRHPLVFLNGCHTTALDPAHAFDLVTGFIETAGASGVIGTEITIFESLACGFAEAFMELFVTQRRGLGEAVRLARLRLLQEGNPLGLVYIPFGLASLKLG